MSADLTIVDVQTLTFRYRSRVGRDEEGHAHPAPEHDATQTLLRVRTSSGVDGHCFGASPETAAAARQLMVGLDALDRERIWMRLRRAQRLERRALDDANLAVVDQALWDVAGQMTGLSVSKLLGGFRDKV